MDQKGLLKELLQFIPFSKMETPIFLLDGPIFIILSLEAISIFPNTLG